MYQWEGIWRIKEEWSRGRGHWEKTKRGGVSATWEVQERLEEGGRNSRRGSKAEFILTRREGGSREGKLVDACLSCPGTPQRVRETWRDWALLGRPPQTAAKYPGAIRSMLLICTRLVIMVMSALFSIYKAGNVCAIYKAGNVCTIYKAGNVCTIYKAGNVCAICKAGNICTIYKAGNISTTRLVIRYVHAIYKAGNVCTIYRRLAMSALFIEGWQYLHFSYKAVIVCAIYKVGNVFAIHTRLAIAALF